MFDPFSTWNRLLVAGASVTRTNMRAVETLTAANAVVAARGKIIEAAVRSPLTGDHAELGRMVPEKVDAFSRAGSATVTAWWEAQSAWARHMQHLGGMAMRGRPPTPAELADLGSRAATLTLESIEAAARLGSTALAPVHRKATANARRLKRKTARRSR
ncbi:hypothetical protein [Sphingomonas oligoaromativorans]|uniref:hypothetical protein n=1 Tax=Sphingomonas oligoaromativorans TaxID=575322 RepID=UPI00141E8847|nr:hypothetical protein [Sphingomonas oligoaromativorans]NIJ34051.1 hypothetical protein [Sphingomonas oligoaromativorans]